MEALIEDWKKVSPLEDPDTLILCSTRADASALNALAQDARRVSKVLGRASIQVGRERLHPGDRVMFTKPSMAVGVLNGDLGKVMAVSRKGLKVKLDSGVVVKVHTDSYRDICLGYAMTTHKAQGLTAERSFLCVHEAMLDREMAYVQASRAKGETRWYVSSELQSVTRKMEFSRQKLMATSILGMENEPRL